MLRVGDCLANGDVTESGQADDVTSGGSVGIHPLEPVEHIQLGDSGALDVAVELGDGHLVSDLDGSVEDPSDRNPAEIVTRVEVGYQELKRFVDLATRRAHVFHDRFKEGAKVLPRLVHARRRGPGLGVREEHREVDLVVLRVEVDEEVVDLAQYFWHARVVTVDLVDDHDRGQPSLQCLSEDEPSLRERTLGGIDEQHYAVDHREGALDLATKISVAGRVHDVDCEVFIAHGRVLGHDGDAPFTLEIGVVERPLGHPLVRTKDPALMEECIH